MALVKKLSVKTVCGVLKGRVAKEEIKDGQTVMRVAGIATGIQTGESDNGPWTALMGRFNAQDMTVEGSEKMTSAKLFMPDVANDIVVSQLVGGADNVEFAFDIAVAYDEDSATGYVYTAIPLFEAAEDDALARLEQKMAALEAPKTPAKDGAKK